MADKNANSLVASLEKTYAKLPPLPVGVKDFVVLVSPWLSLVFGVLGVLAALSAFGLSAVFSPFVALGGGVGLATGLIVASVIGLIESVLMVLAFPGLLKRKAGGWNLLFWSEALAVVGAVISISLVGVVLALVWFYFLFQIKSYYK